MLITQNSPTMTKYLDGTDEHVADGSGIQKFTGVAETVHDGLKRIRALPGVVAATAACCVPLEDGYSFPFHIIGVPTTSGALRWHPSETVETGEGERAALASTTKRGGKGCLHSMRCGS
jgi:hypothetical protein